MKKNLMAVFFAFLSGRLFAQDKLPPFGKIDKADLEMAFCSFEPDAPAMLLIDKGEVSYNLNGGVYLQTDIRQRIKILKKEGIARAEIKIDYYSKDRYEEISHLEGYVYNQDAHGNIITTKLDKSAFYNAVIDDKFDEIAVAFPQVKVGSVIEYRYRSYKKTIAGLRNWNFQGSIPCRYSEYDIFIPSYFEFTYQITHRQPFEVKAPSNNSAPYFYAMRNIPSLKEEPYMNAYANYIQRIEFQLSAINYPNGEVTSFRTTWDKLNDELLEDENFGAEIKRTVPHVEDLQVVLKPIQDSLERMKAVYSYVQKNMDWNGADGIYSADGIKRAWDQKNGTAADINLLLVNLLRMANLKAYPMLVSTKEHGKLNTAYPYLGQFNLIMAYVEIAGNFYCLNAADKVSPYCLIPYNVQTTQGFVIDKVNSGWKSLTNTAQKYIQTVSLFANIDTNGQITGEAVVSNSGHARSVFLAAYNKNKTGSIFIVNNLELDQVEVKNLDADSLPVDQKAVCGGIAEQSGNYLFLPYNFLIGLPCKTPFTAEKRQSDVDFNYVQSFSISGSYNIPIGFSFEELPRSMALIMPDTSIVLKRIIEPTDENLISFRVTLDFNRAVYGADEYADLKEFFQKMYAILDEKIVVKMK